MHAYMYTCKLYHRYRVNPLILYIYDYTYMCEYLFECMNISVCMYVCMCVWQRGSVKKGKIGISKCFFISMRAIWVIWK